ncbi:glycoside hydrolase superfamily [Schizophyllum commune]
MAYRVDAQSGDGGLYGELLQNRALQLVQPGSSDALQGWNVLGDADLSVIEDDNPVSSALPNSLKLVIPDETANTIGFSNSGYWGMKVEASALYNASFYYRFPQASNFSGGLSLALQSSSGDVLASAIVNVSGEQTDWLQASAALVPLDSAVDVNNVFTVSLDGSAAAGQTIHFAMFSLSPPTFKNRHNGMRTDIAQALVNMGSTFFRLPGGNNLGYTVALRWKWNETIGDLVERPGRQGTWNYVNTDGLGLYEYLLWCEDTGMEPILGVFAGYSLDQRTVPEDQLGAYVQEAIDMIHFAISDPAKNDAGKFSSHPLPFSLKYVEVGNEDGISDNALDTYAAYRWRAYSTALQAEFPSLTLIATTRPNLAKLEPAPAVHDIHDYEGPDWFRENVFYFDDVERDGTLYIESEYSCQYDRQGQVNLYPTVLSAVHEAAFMTGLERNSDIVLAASYAPLLNHVNATQWAPNLIAFDAGNVYLSTSYYVQQLFGRNRGEEYLPSTLPERNGTLYWSVARNDSAVIIKVANLATDAASLTFQLPFDSVAESGVLTYITGSETDENTPEQPDLVTPQTSTVETGSTFNYTAPGSSFGVLVVGV